MHKIKKYMINQVQKKLFKAQHKMGAYKNKISLHKSKYDQKFSKSINFENNFKII